MGSFIYFSHTLGLAGCWESIGAIHIRHITQKTKSFAFSFSQSRICLVFFPTQFCLQMTVNRVGRKQKTKQKRGRNQMLRKPSIFFGLMREKQLIEIIRFTGPKINDYYSLKILLRTKTVQIHV
jgi:hypothetical protein